MDKREVFRGALLGLAVGDAMGYTVDKKSLDEIREDYGPNGLLGYDLVNGYADITSYTQTAAFVGNGLLMGLTRRAVRGTMAKPVNYAAMALKEWSRSQQFGPIEKNYCWLSATPELKRRHCLDTRVLDMLSRERLGTLEEPVARMDSPSTLTTALPVAMLAEHLHLTAEEADRLAADIVALTHGDGGAYLSAATLCHVLGLLLDDPTLPLEDILSKTVEAIQLQFGKDHTQTSQLWELLQMTKVLMSDDSLAPMEAMEQLRCTTAAEVLCGALYACATCHGDFDAAIITAVNHSGRSAAVGAITGMVMGLLLGESALPDFYLESLECAKTLRALADDLMVGCPMDGINSLFDDDWDRKYLRSGV